MASHNRIGVVGLGYIGLPTAAVLASHGFDVHGVDIRESVARTVAEGRVHFVEPGLETLVQAGVAAGKLHASIVPVPCDVFILAVPTPFKQEHLPDLKHVESAAASIAPILKKGDLVILESTSPVGTTEAVARQLAAARPDLAFPGGGTAGHDVHLAHCPERVLPGNILHELVHNARIVGGLAPCCTERTLALYRTFVKGQCLATNALTAEMAKLAENAYRDVNIAFANELSMISDRLGIDVHELIGLANQHPRVNILVPGAGVGGHCIAVDPWFIVSSAPKESRLIHAARLVNDDKPEWVVNWVLQAAATLATPRCACLGLTYKADVDDIRESPSVQVIAHLADRGLTPILVHDPFITALPPAIRRPGIELAGLDRILGEANVLAVLTPHRQYRELAEGDLTGKQVIDPAGAIRAAPRARLVREAR